MGVQGPSESVDDAAAVCVLRRFTALFTAHDTRLPVGSAAGCGPSSTCFRSHELLGRWGGPGGGLERWIFCPSFCYIISVTLKDRNSYLAVARGAVAVACAVPDGLARRGTWD